MGLLLKQSTGVTVKIGPFVDETDGKTAETGLTLTQGDIRLSKNGGNMAQKNEASAATHDEIGYYDCAIDATDTDTLGRLQLMVHESGALPVYHEYMVVTANVYDTWCGSDLFQTDLTQIGGAAQSATDLKDFADAGYNPATHKVEGLVLCDTTTTNTDLTAHTANYTAARAGYLDELAAANLPTDVANVKAETALIVADTNELQTDWVNGGRLDLLLDAAKEAVDTEVAAIKAVTDTLSLAAIADAVHDEVVEGALTLRHIARLLLSAEVNKTSGGGTNTLIARDLADTKPRITLTVDIAGNRTASVVDGA